jgi:hypothetical protein
MPLLPLVLLNIAELMPMLLMPVAAAVAVADGAL